MAFIILFLVSIPAIWNLIIPGHFQPHDLHHLADIYEMARSFSGQFPPRWAPDFTGGFGYPLFSFYYVLPFYIGAFFYSILGSLTESIKLVFLLCFTISIWGMYRFLREFFDKWPSILGTVVFTYAPYRAVQIYVRGAVGEALALALLPVVAYFLVKLVKTPNTKNISLTSISLALFIATHNYMWFLSLPFIYVLLPFLISKKELVKSGKALLLSSILGLGAVSYWVFPAIFELKYIPRLTPFLLEDHFPFLKQLILPSWGYGASVWGPYDGLSFQIGIVNLLSIALLVALFVFRFKNLSRQKLLLAIWTLACFFIAVAFMNVRTLPLWKILPIYNFVQFPWRLLYLTAFFTSIAGALIVELLPKGFGKKLSVILIVACLFLTKDYFKPSSRIYLSDQHYFNLFFNDPNYSEDYLLLTQWSDQKPTLSKVSKFTIEGGSISNITQNTPVNWSVIAKANEPAVVTFNSYYFPGWFVKVDGNDTEIVPGKPYGQVTFSIPQGDHQINVYWKETKFRIFFDIISIASISFIIFLFYKKED